MQLPFSLSFLGNVFSLDNFDPRPRAKFALHIATGVLLLPCVICGIARLSGGGATIVIGQVGVVLCPFFFFFFFSFFTPA